ncbi:hypothetical protein [Ammoniphilus sp. YIM 78166]|uniref:hypothetical protein n=1 Tax=Ammoniphilus sp. YIM 78166 TaxID=1644106 RepID=UPI001F0EF2B1|nr:hypothetical protein [Ammoniphilus sp. YIM 78166]
MIYTLILLGLLGVAASLFINMHPVFGGNLSNEQKELYSQLDNYANGKFVNQVLTTMDMSLSDHFSMMQESISGGVDRNPASQIPVSTMD